jgi:RNA polymerase sigma factor (TIGR02999 family)
MRHSHEITDLLLDLQGGNRTAANRIFPLLYKQLRNIASRKLRSERHGHTLNTTDLVHEAYLRLVDQSRANWQNRAHFLAIAAQAMRRILIDYARSRSAKKRGGSEFTVAFNEQKYVQEVKAKDLIELDSALNELKAINSRQASVIEFWFFCGLKHKEIAEVLGVSVFTVRRDWRISRAWLASKLKSLQVEGRDLIIDRLIES